MSGDVRRIIECAMFLIFSAWLFTLGSTFFAGCAFVVAILCAGS